MSPPQVPQERIDALLPAPILEELALNHKVDAKNQIRLPGKLVFLCLLHNLLHHQDVTQRLLEETYLQKVGRRADHSSFGARLATIKPAYFEAIFSISTINSPPLPPPERSSPSNYASSMPR